MDLISVATKAWYLRRRVEGWGHYLLEFESPSILGNFSVIKNIPSGGSVKLDVL